MKAHAKQGGKQGFAMLLSVLLLGIASLACAAGEVVDVQGHGVGQVTFGDLCANVSNDDYPLCATCGDGCMVETVAGRGLWQHVGAFEWEVDFVFDPATATPNLAGGYCYAAYGVSRHRMNNGSLVLDVNVKLCDVGMGMANSEPLTFSGAFSIGGGSGHFEDAAGFGSIAGGINGSGRMLVNVDGTLDN